MAAFRRCASVWILVLSLTLAGTAHAGDSWPRLPTDAEIDAAREKLLADRNFENAECGSHCTSDRDSVEFKICFAKACGDGCRFGPRMRKSELAQVELIKAHQPLDPNPASSAFVFALTTTRWVTQDCDGKIDSGTHYSIEMLAYWEYGWHFSSNRVAGVEHQKDPSSQAQRDAEFASYFGPQRLARGFPEVAGATADPWRLTVNAPDATHPLRLSIRVERLREAAGGPLREAAQASYEPAPAVTVAIGATSYAGNEGRLALHLESKHCRNCAVRTVNGRDTQAVEDWKQPVLLQTDAQGEARIEFFLDFAALVASRSLTPGEGLTVPLLVSVRAADVGQPERVQKELRFEAGLEGIGIVEAIRFQPSRAAGTAAHLPEVPLSEYRDDPGTRDGERMLVGKDRVLVKRAGAAQLMAEGAAPGEAMIAGHILQVGDYISVNACGTDTRPLIDGLPAGLPAQIWVTVRYFDGLRGQFGVNAQVCKSALMIGKSWSTSGFLSLGERFLYWAAQQGMDAAVVWLFAPAKLYTVPGELLGWVRTGLGYEASYVILNSAVTVESAADGTLAITTREGDPRVVTASTGQEGVAVPVGMTATIIGDTASIDASAPERAAQADSWLAQLDDTSAVDTGTHIEGIEDLPSSAYGPADLGFTNVETTEDLPWAAILTGAVAGIALMVWVRRRRAPAAVAAAPVAARPRRKREPKSAPKCPACGVPASSNSARFCGACGHALGADR